MKLADRAVKQTMHIITCNYRKAILAKYVVGNATCTMHEIESLQFATCIAYTCNLLRSFYTGMHATGYSHLFLVLVILHLKTMLAPVMDYIGWIRYDSVGGER